MMRQHAARPRWKRPGSYGSMKRHREDEWSRQRSPRSERHPNPKKCDHTDLFLPAKTIAEVKPIEMFGSAIIA